MPNQSTPWLRILDRFNILDIFRLPQPTLIDRGFGLIYDTERDITWLQDMNYAKTVGRSADGQLTWPAAMAWVSSLNYRGIRGWRLPTALNRDGSGPVVGNNCVGSELGHLYLDVFATHPNIVTLWNGTTGRRLKRQPKKPMRLIFSVCARARFGRIHSNRGFQACRYRVLCCPGQCMTGMWQQSCAPIGCNAFSRRSFLCFDLEDIRVRANSAGSIIELVGRDLELVTVGIMKIDGVRNLVILEFEFDSALFEFALCSEKIFAVRAKGEVKHSNFAVT